MAGRELVVRKAGNFNVREEAARATLRDIRLRGHVYVDLREVGKRTIFFCTLCLTPCYSDSALFDHLRGNLHAQRYATAQVTLFGPVPWPFNDGVLFFSTIPEQERHSSVSGSQKDMILYSSTGNRKISVNELEITSKPKDGGQWDLVSTDANLGPVANSHSRILNSTDNDCNTEDMNLIFTTGSLEHSDNGNIREVSSRSKGNGHQKLIVRNGHDGRLNCNGREHHLTISGVLLRDKVSVLGLCFMGFGHIASRVCRIDEVGSKIQRIWCAWLGEEGGSDDGGVISTTPKCDFAVVNFSYSYILGRRGGLDALNPLLSSGSHLEIEDAGSLRKRSRKSFSDPEETSEGRTDRSGSSDEDSPGSNSCNDISTSPKEDQHQRSIFVSSKAIRRELRRQKRLAAERMCDICGQPMLLGKDVAVLLNQKTGNIACSSRNTNGAFHVFHTSCLVHWILLCEFEMWTDKSANKKPHRGRKGRTITKTCLSSIFCPECQGTGKSIKGDRLEKPTVPLSEVFLYKMKAIQSHKAWMKNPEILHKCSTGLYFPSESEEKLQEQVLPMKLLHFYQADG